MQYLVTLILASTLVFGGLWVNDNKDNLGLQPQPSDAPITTVTPRSQKVLGTQVVFSEPVKLAIPKIGVEAVVEEVGVDAQQRMDVPKGADNAGWFKLGVKPGEKGNAVLAGHLDKVTGSPAVFYNLSKLQVGDEIISTDKNGKELKFKVTEKVVYPYNEVPLEYVFGASDKARLNLITCNGSWSSGAQNYSHRMVVYSELVSD